MSPYVRKVKTTSGATAVQIVEKRSGVRRVLEHLGLAQSEADLAALMQSAQDCLNAGQQAFDVRLAVEAGFGPSLGSEVVAGTRCKILWEVLSDAYAAA